MTLTTPQLITASNYQPKLLEAIRAARHRIVICSMTVTAGPKMDVIFSALHDAVSKGVSVTLVFDVYSKLLNPGVSSNARNQRGNLRQHLESLKLAGAQLHYVSSIQHNPLAGRSHTKLVIADDRVFCFGGMNLKESSFSHSDYMLAYSSSRLASVLEQYVRGHLIGNDLSDEQQRLDANTVLLIDGGQKRSSIIYRKACELAEEAERVWLVSRMAPSGRLASILSAKEVRLYYNHPLQASLLTGAAIIVDQLRYGLSNSYALEPYLHAKCMLFETKSGKRQLISGSNNFNWRGVKYGTKELALWSSDPRLWDIMHAYVESLR